MNWTRRKPMPERLGERPRGQRLADPGHVLEQDVAAGEDAGQDEAQRLALADEGLADPVDDRGGQPPVLDGAHNRSIASTVRASVGRGRRALDDVAQEVERFVAEHAPGLLGILDEADAAVAAQAVDGQVEQEGLGAPPTDPGVVRGRAAAWTRSTTRVGRRRPGCGGPGPATARAVRPRSRGAGAARWSRRRAAPTRPSRTRPAATNRPRRWPASPARRRPTAPSDGEPERARHVWAPADRDADLLERADRGSPVGLGQRVAREPGPAVALQQVVDRRRPGRRGSASTRLGQLGRRLARRRGRCRRRPPPPRAATQQATMTSSTGPAPSATRPSSIASAISRPGSGQCSGGARSSGSRGRRDNRCNARPVSTSTREADGDDGGLGEHGEDALARQARVLRGGRRGPTVGSDGLRRRGIAPPVEVPAARALGGQRDVPAGRHEDHEDHGGDDEADGQQPAHRAVSPAPEASRGPYWRAPVAWRAVDQRSYVVRTFGCQMNEHDSERIAGLLEADGLVPAGRPRRRRRRRAQHVLHPGERRQQALRQPRPPQDVEGRARRPPDRRVRLPGPEGPRRGAPTQAAHVDVVMGTHNVHRAAELLHESPARRVRSPRSSTLRSSTTTRCSRRRCRPCRETSYNAWVTIQIGCDNNCAFCIVPAVRGVEI